MKYLLTILLLTMPLPVSAKCVIAKKHQVPNHPNGLCFVCSLETVCRHLGYTKATGLVNYWIKSGWTNGVSDVDIEKQLIEYKLPYKITVVKDIRILQDATKRGLPAIIGFEKYSILGAHAVVVVDITTTHVYFIDSNHKGWWWRFEIADFLGQWDGYSCIIEPKKGVDK